MTELGFVACGEDLEFGDGVLIELRGSATIEFVLVRQTIDEETGVVGALAENRRGVIAIEIGLPVDRYARNQLHEIQVVSSVKRHVNDLLGSDGHAFRRRSRLEERRHSGYLHLLLHRADFQDDVKFESAVQRNV